MQLNDLLKQTSIQPSENIEKSIQEIIQSKPGLTLNAYMGLVMQKFKGKVNGKEVMEIINKLIL